MFISTEPQFNINQDHIFLTKIENADAFLANHFWDTLVIDDRLKRKMVSFQANKNHKYYRWYKYKEAFSSDLVKYIFNKYPVDKGMILDPFAGAGTALFACAELSYHADGIEVLPIGQQIISANILVRNHSNSFLIERLKYWAENAVWSCQGKTKNFEVLRITKGAYPPETEYKINRYLYELQHEKTEVQKILMFSLLCILESVSYTRKDGQFLRWDMRSGRGSGKNCFNKGEIISFNRAIKKKLTEIIEDITGNSENMDFFLDKPVKTQFGKVRLLKGSCLNILPKIKDECYTGIITSPPYCNRYDYTRTYALEHAVLGINEPELLLLRQAMLSCTVENKPKELLSINKEWKTAMDICSNQELLHEILNYLEHKKEKKELNNNGIVKMVKGYFYEMACVIQECYRVLKSNGYMFMVNDNVRYAGVSISIDMILSKIAEQIGFTVKNILFLPQGKGNSSQQMDRHGKKELRKCVYVWRKEK